MLQVKPSSQVWGMLRPGLAVHVAFCWELALLPQDPFTLKKGQMQQGEPILRAR